MKESEQVCTLGLWTARHGKEEIFKQVWESFARWSSRNAAGAMSAMLLQNKDDPRKFVSLGPWENEASMIAWRSTPEFKDFVNKAKELCEEFRPMALRAAVTL